MSKDKDIENNLFNTSLFLSDLYLNKKGHAAPARVEKNIPDPDAAAGDKQNMSDQAATSSKNNEDLSKYKELYEIELKKSADLEHSNKKLKETKNQFFIEKSQWQKKEANYTKMLSELSKNYLNEEEIKSTDLNREKALKIIGVLGSVTEEELKNTYNSLMKIFHGDKGHFTLPYKAKVITMAYQYLKQNLE